MHKIYLLLLLATLVYAQSVNFSEVLKFTMDNNKDLKTQKLNIETSSLNKQMVDSISYGKVSVAQELSKTNHSGYVFNSKLSSREATFNDFGAGDFQGISSLTVEPKNLNYPDARNNINTKITYDIPLFTGFKLSNQEDILKLQEKANEIKYSLDTKELSFEVLKAYNSAVVAKEFVSALSKAKIAISQIVKSADAFYKEGLVTKIDLNEAKVYESNINSQFIEASNNFQLALAYLRFLSSNETISDVKNFENINSEIFSQSLSYTQALENRDEIKMQDINVNATKKNIEIANSAYYPSVYSHLEYGFNDNKMSLDDEKDYYMALIGINFILFDNTRDIEKEKSKIDYMKATLNSEKLKDAIRLEIEKTILNLQTKEKILEEKIQSKNLAFDILEQSKLLYKNHLISMTTLLLQEANFRKSEALLIQANFEKAIALAKINLVLGKNINGENN